MPLSEHEHRILRELEADLRRARRRRSWVRMRADMAVRRWWPLLLGALMLLAGSVAVLVGAAPAVLLAAIAFGVAAGTAAAYALR